MNHAVMCIGIMYIIIAYACVEMSTITRIFNKRVYGYNYPMTHILYIILPVYYICIHNNEVN